VNPETHPAANPPSFAGTCYPVGVLLALYLVTRMTHLTVLPIFGDEAVYLHWAEMIREDAGNLWISLEADNKKPFLFWLLAAGLRMFPDPLWAGRMVSVAAGAFSLVGIYCVGRRLHSVRAGQVAACLYIVSPYHLFFDRMVYESSLIDCIFIWTIWLTLALLRKENCFLLYGLLALLVGLGLLTHSFAVLFVFLPLFFKLVFWREKDFLPWRGALPAYLAGMALGGAPYGILYFTAEKFSINNYFIPTTHNLGRKDMGELLAEIPAKALAGLSEVLNYFTVYLTWPVFLSAALFLIWRSRAMGRGQAVLLTYFLLPSVILLGTAGTGFSRYYLFCATPLLLWAGQAMTLAWNFLREKISGKPGGALAALLACALIFPAGRFDYRLLTRPEKAPLPAFDRYQYISSRYSGYGIPGAVGFFRAAARGKKIVIFTSIAWGNPADAIQVYLHGHPNIEIYMAYWMYEMPLLPEQVETILTRQPFTKKPLREIRVADLGEVYFIWRTSPKFSRKEFLAINPDFRMVKAFAKPGSRVFVEIYKRQPPAAGPQGKS